MPVVATNPNVPLGKSFFTADPTTMLSPLGLAAPLEEAAEPAIASGVGKVYEWLKNFIAAPEDVGQAVGGASVQTAREADAAMRAKLVASNPATPEAVGAVKNATALDAEKRSAESIASRAQLQKLVDRYQGQGVDSEGMAHFKAGMNAAAKYFSKK